MQSLNYVAPFDAEIHNTLGDWLIEANDPEAALVEYQVALALEPHDLASAHYRVARALNQLQEQNKSRHHLLSALEIAPHFREAQKLLLEITKKNHAPITGENDQ
jgi:tetratricopeptide (TPR) repeat protein